MADQEPQLLSPEDYEKLKAEVAQRRGPQSIQVEPQQQNTITGSAGMFPSAPRQTITPETADALVRAQQTLTQPDFDVPEALASEGQRKGIPFDRDSGVVGRNANKSWIQTNPGLNWLPGLISSVTGAESEAPTGDASVNDLFMAELGSQTPSAKARYLSELMGLKVEAAPNGDYIARDVVDKKTGITKDVAINPRGFGIEDMVPFVAQLPLAVAEGALALRMRSGLRGKAGLSDGLGSLAATTVASVGAPAVVETLGGLKDYAMNLYETGDGEAKEVFERRLRNIQWSAAFNLGGIAFGSASKLVSPFEQHNQEARRIAAEALELSEKGGTFVDEAGVTRTVKGHGVKYKPTPGEESGSPTLFRLESVQKQLIGGNKIAEQMQEQVKQRQKIQQAYVTAKLPTAEDMGEALKGAVKPRAQQALDVVGDAEEALRRAAVRETQEAADAFIQNRVSPVEVGRNVRTVIRGEYADTKEGFNDRYDAFLRRPEITEDVDVREIIRPRAQAILDDLPSFRQEVVQATGLLDNLERPLTSTVETERLFNRFVPQKFVRQLEQLVASDKVSVKSIKELRTSIDNDIAEGLAIPDTSVQRLTQLREALNESITEMLRNRPDLLAEWQGLSTDYAGFRERFANRYIQKIMVPDGDVGSMGNTEIVYNLIGRGGRSVDNFNNLRDFFGNESVQFRAIQNAMREKLVDDAVSVGDTISVGAINGIIDNLDPTIARELFRPGQIESIRNVARSLKRTSDLDSSEVRALMRRGTLTGEALVDLAHAEKTRAALLRNRIFDGTIKDENPVLLARELLKPDTSPKMLEPFLKQLEHGNPEVRQQYANFATEHMIQRMSEFSGIEKALDNEKMVKFFRDPENANLREVYRLSVGDPTYYGLERFAKGMEPAVSNAILAGDAGGMSKTMQVTHFTTAPKETSIRAAQRWILSSLYTAPKVRSLILNGLMPPERVNAFIDGLLVSAPAVEYLTRTYGDHAADVAAAAGWLANQRDARQSQELHLLAPEKLEVLSNEVNRARSARPDERRDRGTRAR